MDALPEPTCADCLGFTREGRDGRGRTIGRCRFRTELPPIPDTFPHCPSFRVRASRAGAVRIPPPPKRAAGAPRGGRRVAATDDWLARRTLRNPATGDTSGEMPVDRNGLKQILRELLEEETLYGYPPMARRWRGGTLRIVSADPELQPKEIPVDTLFHKIVMLRDRLRVLESKINGHDKLDDADRVELQQYISKIYGTLTTFNALFADKADHFRSK